MLDKAKVLQALQEHTDKLFTDLSHEYSVARSAWEQLCKDPHFAQKIMTSSLPWTMPLWQGDVGALFPVPIKNQQYVVLGVDGSQIYPDKHQGTMCSLINIGIVEISYKTDVVQPVRFRSEPKIMIPQDEDLLEHSVDTINCHRQEMELLAAYEWHKQLSEFRQKEYLVMCDGSLIFWHLESKQPEIKHKFLTSYLALMQQMYESNILMCGYISMPKSKDLINLVRAQLCNFNAMLSDAHHQVDQLVDSHVAHFYLEPHFRTQLFKSMHAITNYYPIHLQPYFFYMNVGTEIVRIEIPAWIARDENLVDCVGAIALDQAQKGNGYPVVLAEAHEQAVVKGPDREFFYHLIQKVGIEQQRRILVSPKSLKKRGIGI